MLGGGSRMNSSGLGSFLVDEVAYRSRQVPSLRLTLLTIQLVATAPRVSKVASYKGVTIWSFRGGVLSGVGVGDAAACAGAGVTVAVAVGCDVGCDVDCSEACATG